MLRHPPNAAGRPAPPQGAQFPLFSKIEVNGENTHEVFRYLKKHLPGEIVRTGERRSARPAAPSLPADELPAWRSARI